MRVFVVYVVVVEGVAVVVLVVVFMMLLLYDLTINGGVFKRQRFWRVFHEFSTKEK